MKRLFNYTFLWLPALCLLSACGHTAPPGMKVGQPYEVSGKTYYPEYDPNYDEIGQASWYGPGFHGKNTASGETYDQDDLTAAHTTLPMPSLVRVTNLSNGRSIIVRVNDRGPFKKNRIIDLSKRAAEKLGMPSTATVRVEYLKQETEEYVASLNDNGKTLRDMMALEEQANPSEAVTPSKEVVLSRAEEPMQMPDDTSEQIVETTDSDTHSGQIVEQAAPVLSVDTEPLYEPKKKSAASEGSVYDKIPPSAIVRQAYADDRIASLAPPLTTQHSAPAKAAMTASFSKQAFYIQAGSFSSEENAHKLSAKLASIGPVEIGKVDVSAKTWWRVRMGPFSEQGKANAILEQVRDGEVPDAHIVYQ